MVTDLSELVKREKQNCSVIQTDSPTTTAMLLSITGHQTTVWGRRREGRVSKMV